MNSQQWIEKAKQNQDKLKSLLRVYHPRSRGPKPSLPITAAGAETACEQIREEVRNEHHDLTPVQEFEKALEAGSVDRIMGILNDAWFGVPESTACWRVTGFSEAVSLLEDPPEDMGPEEEEEEAQ